MAMANIIIIIHLKEFLSGSQDGYPTNQPASQLVLLRTFIEF